MVWSAQVSHHIIFWGEKGQSEAEGAHRKMVTFLRQNLSRIFFSFTDKVMAMTLIHEKIKQKYYFKKLQLFGLLTIFKADKGEQVKMMV